MAKRELPTPEELRQLLRYEPETGKLYWLERPPEMFEGERRDSTWACNSWNARYAGKEAFTCPDTCGYLRGRINRIAYSAHRVIWAITYGEWPPEQIDHINGQRRDNRTENLRSVTHAENMRNLPRMSGNTSGRTGVYWSKAGSKWYALIGVGGRMIYLGTFDCFEDAVAAREKAEIEHGFHPNHDRLR